MIRPIETCDPAITAYYHDGMTFYHEVRRIEGRWLLPDGRGLGIYTIYGSFSGLRPPGQDNLPGRVESLALRAWADHKDTKLGDVVTLAGKQYVCALCVPEELGARWAKPQEAKRDPSPQ